MDEYQTFRCDVAGLADTFEEWCKLLAEEVAEVEKRGQTVVEIEVRHDEFMAYCRTTGQTPDLEILLDFAEIKKAAGE